MRLSPLTAFLLAGFILAPAVALPAWLGWLPNNRPHVTGVHSDFMLPRLDGNGATYYISQQDHAIVLGLWLWLLMAVMMSLVVLGRVYYRPLLRALRPPADLKAAQLDRDAHA